MFLHFTQLSLNWKKFLYLREILRILILEIKSFSDNFINDTQSALSYNINGSPM